MILHYFHKLIDFGLISTFFTACMYFPIIPITPILSHLISTYAWPTWHHQQKMSLITFFYSFSPIQVKVIRKSENSLIAAIENDDDDDEEDNLPPPPPPPGSPPPHLFPPRVKVHTINNVHPANFFAQQPPPPPPPFRQQPPPPLTFSIPPPPPPAIVHHHSPAGKWSCVNCFFGGFDGSCFVLQWFIQYDSRFKERHRSVVYLKNCNYLLCIIFFVYVMSVY